MKTLVLDTEATIQNEGSPFAQSNKLCCVGVYDGVTYSYFDIEHSGTPYGERLRLLQSLLDQTGLLVGHNLKYDIHWLRRYGIKLPDSLAVWDTQIFEYLDSNQRWVMPSLDEACKRCGLEGKTTSLYDTYWSKDIDTTAIPQSELFSYNKGDCVGTYGLYCNQRGRLSSRLEALFKLACDDLLILEDMEYNGMRIDTEKASKFADENNRRYQSILEELSKYDPYGAINWNSNDALSVVLFGGSIPQRVRETVTKQYKSGPKVVERWGSVSRSYPQRFTPIDGTEREKPGFYFVGDEILRQIEPKTKEDKRLLNLILELNDLEKLLNTYLLGLPKLIAQHGWEAGVVHGSFNQCVTRTGRLSSSKPNQQNFAKSIKNLFMSIYDN